ncbi:unnamed protein product [Rhizoctonia solani]|uniref:Bromo domain-containing protein n=1 Tax=Rhizoctonia solani TaxID=456999 RepID=A0A8H3DEE1_9AGAM|nr:unnamed protein product [Rhizoctonia solani]
MKERRARELGRLASIVPEQSESTMEDAQPETPVVETPQTPVAPVVGVEPAEEPMSGVTSEHTAKTETVISETPQPTDVEATPTTAPEITTEPAEEVIENSQPTDDAKGTKVKRRVSDTSMVDALPDPKRPRQEDTEMQDVTTTAPTQSPEPSTPHPTPAARGSTAPTPTRTSTSTSVAPAPAPTQAPTAATNKKFQNVISMVHQQIYQHRGGNIFHNPIKKSEAPDYYEIVRRPMDLKTVKSRIKDGVISSADHFKRDVFLMFANAIMYNRPGTSVNDIAAEMMIESERHIADFRAAEEFNKPGRG